MSRSGGRSGGSRARRTHRRRTLLLATVWTLLAVGYVVRAGELQIVEVEQWRQLAAAQNAERQEIEAPRGRILARDGTVLSAESIRYRAYLAPTESRDPEAAADAIARQLGLSDRQARELARGTGWNAVPRLLSLEQLDRLRAAVRRGLHFEAVSDRVHPQGSLAEALLGAVTPEGKGRSGLELALDSLLRGEAGAALRRRDAMGGRYRLPDAQISAPRPGHDVVLTLDPELQHIAEDALERAMQETGASGGDVLMLDPRSGELLALASRRVDGEHRVPALTDAYEPGSTLKPFLLASLLTEGLVELSDTVDVEQGELRRAHRVIRDVHPHDSLSVAEVIRFSSNVGAAKLSDRIEPGLQYSFLRNFGFGVPTGISYPAESPGRLRRPERWSALSPASLAMGYEISVTSLQLAAAYGALANRGVLMRPYLVREVRDPSGRVVRERRPEPLRRVVPSSVADSVTRVLGTVVEGGTATRAALATLPVAGKTGTARVAGGGGYETGRYASSFVGYTPVEDPRLVILTKLNDPQGHFYGGLTAAPISRSTLQAALATRGVTVPGVAARAAEASGLRWERTGPRPVASFALADASEAGPRASPPDARAGGLRVLPDLTGLPLRTAAARLHELGLKVELQGGGTVRSQLPSPGTRIEAGSRVVLR